MGRYKEENGKTRVGNFLKGIKGVAPDILNLVGNVTGVDVLKNVGEAIKGSSSISSEDKETALELIKLDVADRDSARKREIEVLKTGSSDFMMKLTGIVGLASFMFLLYVVVFNKDVQHNELLIHVMGMVEGVALSIFYYYFGKHKTN